MVQNPTRTISFSSILTVGGDEVTFDKIVFWDGTQNHTIFDAALGGQLIWSLTVPYGALIGFTTIQVANNLSPLDLMIYCEVVRNLVQHGYAEQSVWVPLWDFGNLGGDWNAIVDETVDLNIGFIT